MNIHQKEKVLQETQIRSSNIQKEEFITKLAGPVKSSPLVKKMALEYGINLGKVKNFEAFMAE